MKVNDGKGFYNNEGLIDSLIVDVNNLFKCLASGQYMQYQNISVRMVQKLANLKTGIKSDLESKDKIIADLRMIIDSNEKCADNQPKMGLEATSCDKDL